MKDLSMIRFRDFEKGDTQRILEFKKESASVSFPSMEIDADFFRRRVLETIGSDPGSVKVAELDGKIVGYVYLEIKRALTGTVGYINHVFVSEPFRKSGLGSRLMRLAEDHLRSKGIKRIRVTVTNTNTASISLCKKLGYEEKRTILEKTLN
jgi:ribosomal protein S18 acetylase RimI-like enzyme